MKRILFRRYCILITLLAAAFMPTAAPRIPVTGAVSTALESRTVASSRSMPERISDPGVFSLDIVQQPTDNPGYVSRQEDKITQFRLASEYGSKGFLAHNDLAGAQFFDVQLGDVLTIRYRDSSVETFEVVQIRHLQAVSPLSPYSRFLDLDNNNDSLSAVDLFYQTYGVKDTVVLQTCIANGDELSWGRLFIIAQPITIIPNSQ